MSVTQFRFTDQEPGLCYHCGEPIPAYTHFTTQIHSQERAMCCPGCVAIAQTIVACGMDGFYRARQSVFPKESRSQPTKPITSKLSNTIFDSLDFQKTFVDEVAGHPEWREAHLLLPDVRCGACAWLIEGRLSKQSGVVSAQVNVIGARLLLRWNPNLVALSSLVHLLETIGYPALPWENARDTQLQLRRRRRQGAELAVAGLGMMQVMMYAIPIYLAEHSEITAGQILLMNWASAVLTLPVMLYSARSFWRSAWNAIRQHQLNMDVPVALGLLAAFLGSFMNLIKGQGPVWFDSITMFVFLLLAARWIESAVRERAFLVTSRLAPPIPAQTLRIDPHTEKISPVAVAALGPGDRIMVVAGEVIPVDGHILTGSSLLEEALLTGESRPIHKGPGDEVMAASTNLTQTLEIRVRAVAAQTILSRMLRSMDQALDSRTAMAQLADRAARHFVEGLLLIAACTTLFWLWKDPHQAMAATIAVLVVSCPCALSLAVPAALAASARRLAQRGVFVLKGEAIEQLALAKTMVFDKTGTLTEGRPKVHFDWLNAPTVRQQYLSQICLALEVHQNHPLAIALTAQIQERFPDLASVHVTHLKNVPGHGVEGQIGQHIWRLGSPAFVMGLSDTVLTSHPHFTEAMSESCLGNEEGIQVWMGFEDTVREGARILMHQLAQRGYRLMMLSGDHVHAVNSLARRLEIQEAQGQLLPQDKWARIQELAKHAPVAMVGDGLNDGPGLAAANISIAMGQSSQALIRGVDILIPSGSLQSLGEAIRESVITRQIILQNLVWALVYNVLAIPLAASGVLTPWQAALGMSLSSLFVVINSVRPWRT